MNKIAERIPSLCDKVVLELQAARPGIKTTGFMAEIRKRFGHLESLEEVQRIVPDAYEFHDDLQVVTIIEVVDTNPITPAKAARIYEIADAIPDAGWELTVAVFDNCANLIDEVPGYFFASFYIDSYIGPKCVDVLPAVRKVVREIKKAEKADTEGYSADDLADRL